MLCKSKPSSPACGRCLVGQARLCPSRRDVEDEIDPADGQVPWAGSAKVEVKLEVDAHLSMGAGSDSEDKKPFIERLREEGNPAVEW